MSVLDDLLTTAKNIVIALNGISTAYNNSLGTQHSAEFAAATTTLVATGQGRLVKVSVTVAGSAVGSIYDSGNASSLTNRIAIIPNTAGVYDYTIPYNSGIVVVTGAGQSAVITYS